MAEGEPSNQAPFDAASLQRVASRTLSISDEGDTLWLVNATGKRLDVLAYAPDQHHPAWRETRGRSLERMVIGDRPQVTDRWTTSIHASGATPGLINSVSVTRTEDVPSPSGAAPLSLEGRIIDRRRYSQTTNVAGADGGGTDDGVVLRWHFSSGPVMLTVRVYSEAGALLGELFDHEMIPTHGTWLLDGRLSSGEVLSPGRYILLGTWTYLEGNQTRTGKQKLVVGVR
ncbi:MAG: hypothetical protein EB075_14210 [Bacteroidetes bacterium]|nr:hypothetical protein [Bacteroidota bacterium]